MYTIHRTLLMCSLNFYFRPAPLCGEALKMPDVDAIGGIQDQIPDRIPSTLLALMRHGRTQNRLISQFATRVRPMPSATDHEVQRSDQSLKSVVCDAGGQPLGDLPPVLRHRPAAASPKTDRPAYATGNPRVDANHVQSSATRSRRRLDFSRASWTLIQHESREQPKVAQYFTDREYGECPRTVDIVDERLCTSSKIGKACARQTPGIW